MDAARLVHFALHLLVCKLLVCHAQVQLWSLSDLLWGNLCRLLLTALPMTLSRVFLLTHVITFLNLRQQTHRTQISRHTYSSTHISIEAVFQKPWTKLARATWKHTVSLLLGCLISKTASIVPTDAVAIDCMRVLLFLLGGLLVLRWRGRLVLACMVRPVDWSQVACRLINLEDVVWDQAVRKKYRHRVSNCSLMLLSLWYCLNICGTWVYSTYSLPTSWLTGLWARLLTYPYICSLSFSAHLINLTNYSMSLTLKISFDQLSLRMPYLSL